MSDDPNAVTLALGGQLFGGWQSVRITRGIEIMPSSFDVSLTELYPNQAAAVAIEPGQDCQLRIGNDVVVTGYVDRYVPGIGPDAHQVRVSGRGRCADLVDCAAGFQQDGPPQMQVNAQTALGLAQTLVKPFGIEVALRGAEAGKPINSFMMNFGETVFEVLDRVGRYEGLLAYEDEDGNLVLARAGSDQMASGFRVPGNVEDASCAYAADGLFSDYYVLWTSTDTDSQVRAEINGAFGSLHGHATDPMVKRFRPRAIVSEQMANGTDLGDQRAFWEACRRRGRSQTLQLTCDSWRDTGGTLWRPNALAPVDIPPCKVSDQILLISEVTYRRDDSGTRADVTLMPAAAFEPEPTGLQGEWQIQQALNEGGG